MRTTSTSTYRACLQRLDAQALQRELRPLDGLRLRDDVVR